MHPIFLPLLVGEPFALLDLTHVVQGVMLGAGGGTIAGRLVVHRAEQHGREMVPRRVREIELRWTSAMAIAGLGVSLVMR